MTQPALSHRLTETFLRFENFGKQEFSSRVPEFRRVVIICTDRIGDTFNCLYFLSNLRSLLAETNNEITFIGRKFGDPAFIAAIVGPYVTNFFFKEDLTDLFISQIEADVVFDLNPDYILFPHKLKMGGLSIGHHPQCDIFVPMRFLNCKANDHLNILRSIGKDVSLNHAPIATISHIGSLWLDKFCERPFVVLCLEATATSWMLEKDVSDGLVQHLLKETNYYIYILGNDINQNGYRFGHINHRVCNLTRKLLLSHSIHLMRHARLVISVDTGMMHAASYLGIPLLAVFTCGNPARNGPQGQHGRCVVLKVDVDPPTNRTRKSDHHQSGIEKRYLKLEHLIDGIEALKRATASSLNTRVISETEVSFEGSESQS
jgi:ADP-heptose:LPS heptosyltransferase